AFPTFQLAKVFRKNPAEIAENLAENFSSEAVSSVNAVGPYLNFYLDKGNVSAEVLGEILFKKGNNGESDSENKGHIPLNLASPNIAKPMSMGQLRSTVIGNALANIVEKLGYNPVKINYLGDWGTQFGRLITAYKLWGDEEKVRANPIAELNELYVRFHEEL